MIRGFSSVPALCRGGRSSSSLWRAPSDHESAELPLLWGDRLSEWWARVCDCPSTGHGFRGWRSSHGTLIQRADWISSKTLTPKMRGQRFDFGPRASWRDARALGEALLCHFHQTRHVERILCDEFTRRIVCALPDNWALSDEALAAWVNGFHKRRLRYFGATFVSTREGLRVWPPRAVTSPPRPPFRGAFPLVPLDSYA